MMLTYLVLTTRAILMAAEIAGVLFGYTKLKFEKTQRNTVWRLAIVGTVVSALIAVLKNATNWIDTAVLNGCIYALSLLFFVIYIICALAELKKGDGSMQKGMATSIGMLSASVIAYAMPDVWAYPYHILLSEETVISTDYLLGLIGVMTGVLLGAIALLSAMHVVSRLPDKQAGIVLFLALFLNASMRITGLYSVLFQKKLIRSHPLLFSYTVFVKTHSDFFTYAMFALVAASAIGLWIMSFNQNEPYRNPAQHRKIRAIWRSSRRWGTTALLAGILGICNMTVVEAYNTNEVTLSPIEEVSDADAENLYVSFELVGDGHLHRFAYTTKAGVEIRFIVIQKPGTTSYGIGLDACEVCGETGYYERDGQVVCNRCDVVMNISTIGFKGGCNPIVIPYEIKDGRIIVPIAGLLEYESEFK
ncbi:MAG: Fe-S-containing protein [Lachnospiraceae bacterium]|nr:Fe-S-containing protein [Lachnospiraceae bacterium]